MRKDAIKKLLLYIILGLPLTPIVRMMSAVPWTDEGYRQLIHVSGEMAARLMILTLMITPLAMIFSNGKFWKWMKRNRRILGLASFFYTLIHMCVYLIQQAEFQTVLADLGKLTYIFGWLSFTVLLPIAATSTNWAIQKMGGKSWKRLQRFVYIAALFVILHWLFKAEMEVGPVVVHFAPLCLLQMYRLYYIVTSSRQALVYNDS